VLAFPSDIGWFQDAEAIAASQLTIAPWVVRSPIVPALANSDRILLKLETHQLGGSFKVRGAALVLATLTPDENANGVWTASSGNMATAVGLVGERLDVRSTSVTPENMSEHRLRALDDLGVHVIRVEPSRWIEVNETGVFPGLNGPYLHPAYDDRILIANATIGAEIVEDVPDVDTIITPWGSGGLTCGTAAGAKLMSPRVRVIAAEVEGRSPLSAARAAGGPVTLPGPKPVFPESTGARTVLPYMWECAQVVVDEVRTVTAASVRRAMSFLASEVGVVSEGSGATSLAVALASRGELGKVVCVVSGANVDASIGPPPSGLRGRARR